MFRRFNKFIVYVLIMSMLAGTCSVPVMAASTDDAQIVSEEAVSEEPEDAMNAGEESPSGTENTDQSDPEADRNSGDQSQDQNNEGQGEGRNDADQGQDQENEGQGDGQNDAGQGEGQNDADQDQDQENEGQGDGQNDADQGQDQNNEGQGDDQNGDEQGQNGDDQNADEQGQNGDDQGQTDPTPDVVKTDLSDAELFLDNDNYPCDGTVPYPEVTVSYNGITLEKDTEYEVVYDESAEPGTHVVIVNGIGEYTGTAQVEYTIDKQQQKVTGTTSYTKRLGNAAFNLNAATDGDGTLVFGSSNNKVATVTSAGKVTIKGIGTTVISVYAKETNAYKKSNVLKITIKVNKKLQTVTVTSTYNKIIGQAAFKVKASTNGNGTLKFTSSNKSVAVVDKYGKVTLKAVGIAKISVYATETSTCAKAATKTITIKVAPKKMALSSVTNSANNKVTVKWKKQAGVSGYQIQYSAKKDFSKAKSVTVGASSTAKALSGLTKNATYYVRIRPFKTVSGQKLYSSWSAVKSVKINKGTVKYFGKTPVISIKAHDDEFKNTISWSKLSGASGYQISVKKGNGSWTNAGSTTAVKYVHNVTHGVRFYYKVRAYQDLADGSRIYGKYSAEKNMLQYYKPNYSVFMSSKTSANTSSVAIAITNNGVATMRIYSKNAELHDRDYTKFNRKMYLTNTRDGVVSVDEASYIDIKPGETQILIFASRTTSTWYDEKSSLYYSFRYDGREYYASSSSYYGTLNAVVK